jgi:hypothetical protein
MLRQNRQIAKHQNVTLNHIEDKVGNTHIFTTFV